MINTLTTLHHATQYLACAGKSFLKHQSDDSHTAMTWNSKDNILQTSSLNNEGLTIGLNHDHYALDFLHPASGVVASYPLENARHFDIVNWIDRERAFCGLEQPYTFDLHYDLDPAVKFTDHMRLLAVDLDAMKAIADKRTLAQDALEELRLTYTGMSEIRTWPHHFDTGALIKAGNGVTYSLGLSVPDAMQSTFYFYLSAYRGEIPIDSSVLEPMQIGEWKHGTWNGAILPFTDAFGKDDAVRFMHEGINLIQQHINS